MSRRRARDELVHAAELAAAGQHLQAAEIYDALALTAHQGGFLRRADELFALAAYYRSLASGATTAVIGDTVTVPEKTHSHLPDKCPHCGANLYTDESGLVQSDSIQCLYCASIIRSC